MVTTYRRKAAQLFSQAHELQARAPAAEASRAPPAPPSHPPTSEPDSSRRPTAAHVQAVFASHLPRLFQVSSEPLPARLTELLQRLPGSAEPSVSDAPAPDQPGRSPGD